MAQSKPLACYCCRVEFLDKSVVEPVVCHSCTECYHGSCEKLSDASLRYFRGRNVSYTCYCCRTSHDGSFNYEEGLRRLYVASETMSTLKKAVKAEEIYIMKEQNKVTKIYAFIIFLLKCYIFYYFQLFSINILLMFIMFIS